MSAMPLSVVGSPSVPPPLFVKIILAAVAFDRNLDKRFGDTISVAVTGDSSYSKALRKTLEAASKKKLKGKNIAIKTASPNDFGTKGANIVIFGSDLGNTASEVATRCAAAGITCVATNVRDIESGLSLGIEMVSGKPKLVINARTAAESGADYSSQILRLARVID